MATFGIFQIIFEGWGKVNIKVIRRVENFSTKNLSITRSLSGKYRAYLYTSAP